MKAPREKEVIRFAWAMKEVKVICRYNRRDDEVSDGKSLL